ncbi:MAG: hypothetical protein ABFD16_17905 [Thermoguttaceae bacterium]|jgi:hypothetical protein
MSLTNDNLPTPDDQPVLDDRTLDQLVDGELSPATRRKLLAELDQIPDGWRRCALAFLEAQVWREEFGALAREAEPVPQRVATRPTPRPPDRGWLSARTLGTATAMAASFLVALALGFLVRGSWYSSDQGDLAENGPTMNANNASPAPPQQPSRPEANGPWQTVSLPVAQGDSPLQVPATERDSLDDWHGNPPPAIPEAMLQALEKSGLRVEMERQLMPFPMKDGRQLVVPVDQVELHPVSNTYQ